VPGSDPVCTLRPSLRSEGIVKGGVTSGLLAENVLLLGLELAIDVVLPDAGRLGEGDHVVLLPVDHGGAFLVPRVFLDEGGDGVGVRGRPLVPLVLEPGTGGELAELELIQALFLLLVVVVHIAHFVASGG
jgi:hypothetical protein